MKHFPIAIIEDRYTGAYSEGRWLAVTQYDLSTRSSELNDGPFGDDTEASTFWAAQPQWIAAGDTPDEALHNLEQRLGLKMGALV